nr:RES family NAD+ phosphorylase [uncultured Halomonas sp.]
MSIWQACNGARQIEPLSGTLYRLVESQEQVATLGYVDSLEEQALLEEMLENAKPPNADKTEDVHYLLKTPFRYPPLRWGSRFGRTHEPGIFYGGLSLAATLAESAYYRFVFWYSMDGEPVKDHLRSEHTLFCADYRSDRGIRLQAPPFSTYSAELSHPRDYAQAQRLGTAMREAGVEIFEYCSARDPQHGHCAGLFTPSAFMHKQPNATCQWLCEIRAQEVSFKPLRQADVMSFALKSFLIDGELPMPAG